MRGTNIQQNKLVLSSLVIIVTLISFILYLNLSSNSIWSTLSFSSTSISTKSPITYLPYTFGYAALLQTLHAYSYAGWKDIVIVDNSWDHHAHQQLDHLLQEFKCLKGIIKTPVHLRFTQLQGMIDHLAREDGADVYLWGHTDIILLQNGTNPYQNMLKGINHVRLINKNHHSRLGFDRNDEEEEAEELNGKLGIGLIFYHYDLLSAVFVEASAKSPWDPAMPQYGSDCDRYHRLRLAGYITIEDPYSIGTIVHQHSILTHEQKIQLWDSGLNIDEQVKLLGEINSAAEQYAWRNGGQQEGKEEGEENDWHDSIQQYDREAAAAEGSGGKTYFEAKWGPFDCELEGRIPFFDIPNIS